VSKYQSQGHWGREKGETHIVSAIGAGLTCWLKQLLMTLKMSGGTGRATHKFAGKLLTLV